MTAQALPFVLRTAVGMAALAVGANAAGVVVVALVVGAMNTGATGHQFAVVTATTVVLLVASFVIGVSAGALVQRRTLRWVLSGATPSLRQARQALRLPLDMSVIAVVLWTIGGLVVGAASAFVGQGVQTVLGIVGGTVLGGLASAGVTYLLIVRVNEPVALLALRANPPRTSPVFSLSSRLVLSWLLTTGAPIAGLVLVLTAPHGKTHVVGTSIAVATVALVVGGLSTVLTARQIGEPLRHIVAALGEVGDGRLDRTVEVEDAGEIGLLQSGFNDMVQGLRERERIQDLFGRHVGSAVAAQAIEGGVTLRGESREVVALFVDITGSTALTRVTDPVEFVAMLNRFFAVVVDEVESNGGLLNKFEGDAALCIFGAPAQLADPASAALRAARCIRDRVARSGELSIGVGVAAGQVIAGQIGAPSRLEYTIIGDAVNEAARLTEQAKRVDGHVLAGGSVVAAATASERARWVAGRALQLRGRATPTQTYRTATVPDGSAGAPAPGRTLAV